MPTYDYLCPECEAARSVTRSIKDPIVDVYCEDPNCRTLLRRVYYPTGAIFRGGGWGHIKN